jgi:tRNA(Leu) C34 or U34 (ribose-2'-O)-methylase TrmL
MIPGTRALNLSNAVAICLYDAWRQVGFPEWAKKLAAW